MYISFSMLGMPQSSQQAQLPPQPNFDPNQPLTLPTLLSHIRSSDYFPLYPTRLSQYQSHCLLYSDLPSNILKWLDLSLPHYTFLHSPSQFLFSVNSYTTKLQQTQYSSKIKQHILSKNNFLRRFIKECLFIYLFKKYEVHNYTDDIHFVEEFERDVEWIKEYLTIVIVKVYGGWIEDKKEAQAFFNDKGVFEIVTEMEEWEIIYKIFNKCLPKHKSKISQQDIEVHYNSIIKIKKQNIVDNQQNITVNVPFQKTISFLRQFSETKQISLKMQQLKKLDHLLVSEIKQLKLSQKEDVDQYSKRKHLQYCIYVSGKQIIKSVIYIETIIGKQVIDCKSRFRESKFIMRSLYDASYTLLCDYYQSYKKLYASQKYISFKIPKERRVRELEFKVESVKVEDVFRTDRSTIVLFSTASLIVSSFIKIQIISEENTLALGICNKKRFQTERNLLQHSQNSIMLNVKNKRVYHKGKYQQKNIQGHIHRVGLVVKNDEEVEWMVNDKSLGVVEKYKGLVEEMGELFACVEFRKGTEFRLVEF